MQLTLGGVRGSCPVAQADFMRYGGETTSFLIEGAAGERILVDAGTGVRKLGRYLMNQAGASNAWLFMTHYHLDHLAGLPMLPLLNDPAWSLVLAAPDHHGVGMQEIMSRIMDRPFWPVQAEDVQAHTRFEPLDEVGAACRCGGIEVRWCPLHHPGGSTAYRFDEPSTGGSVVIATDVEWGASSAKERTMLKRLLTWPAPAALLVMDGQYQDETVARFRGWGHSTWQEAVRLGRKTGVGQVVITHHDPSADDEALDRIAAVMKSTFSDASLGCEGQVFTWT